MASDRHTSKLRPTGRKRAGLVLALLLAVFGPFSLAASAREPASIQDHAASPQHERPATAQEAHPKEAEHGEAHEEPLWKTAARLFNFAVLAGVLVYFLKAPIAGYLSRRSSEITSELTKAAETREAASRDLERIEQRMASLPAEIEALKARGAEEIAAEEARIRRAAETERKRLLEQARREIDVQVRTAERDLVRHAAELTVGLASDRIKRTITGADQLRLVDRYLSQLEK